MSSIINRIISLFQNKQMYISTAVIALLLLLLSLIQKNTMLLSLMKMFVGTVIIVILITIVWVVLSIIIEPVLAGNKEDATNDKDISSNDIATTTVTATTAKGRELGVAADDIDINEINSINTDIDDIGTNNSSGADTDEEIKSTLNENKENKDIDNSAKSLYHKEDSKPINNSNNDSGSIDFIFSSNDDNSKDVEISPPEQIVSTSNDSGIAGFDDFGDPAVIAQAIRTVRSKDEDKG